MKQLRIPEKHHATTGDQFGYSLRYGSDNQIHWVIYFDGRVDEGRLGRAVKLSMDAEPVLGCRFVMDKRPYYKRIADLDQIELCQVMKVDDTQKALREIMDHPIKPKEGPFVRAFILRSNTDTLVIKTDHTVADAGGATEYMTLLSSIYRCLENDPGYQPDPNVNGDRSLRQVLKQIGLPRSIRSLSATINRHRNRPDDWSFPWAKAVSGKADTADRARSVRTLSPEQFRAIRNYAKRYNATINDVMVTAFFRTVARFAGLRDDNPHDVHITVDLRRFLPDGKGGGVCNLTSFMTPALYPRAGSTFEKAMVEIRDTINKIKDVNPGLGEWLFIDYVSIFGLRTYFSLAKKTLGKPLNSMRITPWVSNVGVLSRENLNFGDVGIYDADLVGPFMYPPGFMFVISTFDEVMKLYINYCAATANRPVAEQFLDMLVKEIEEACPVTNGSPDNNLELRS
ncbi:MAG: hypothetical protein JW738_06735 [Actinobacteria bacterium]|nr:hypothetical protein [Actinomycetota bacterium]